MSLIALPALLAPREHLFLSPHFDDVALSAGGTAALLARHGRRPAPVVLCGGDPAGAAFSAFAHFQHARWGLAEATAVASRQAEETAAAAIIGMNVRLLPFLDAIYRGDRYQDDDQLFGEPAADEADLPRQMRSALGLGTAARADTRVYAPLAVGGHVDHRHAFQVGLDLARAGWSVWFYEDQPYALDAYLVAERVRTAGVPMETAAAVEVTETWQAKVDAVLAYASQVPVIFRHVAPGGDPAAVEAVLARCARARGCGLLAERFWRPAGR